MFGTSSVLRRRLSKGHRPFRHLPPIKFLYLRYLWLCAFRIAPPIPIRASAQRFWSIFSERPRPLNHLHRRALERIPDALFWWQLTFCCTSFPLPKLRRPLVAHIRRDAFVWSKICRRDCSLFSLKGSDLCFATSGAQGRALFPRSPSGKIALTPYKQAICIYQHDKKNYLVQYGVSANQGEWN
jgi:hypothetical protein